MLNPLKNERIMSKKKKLLFSRINMTAECSNHIFKGMYNVILYVPNTYILLDITTLAYKQINGIAENRIVST